MFRTINQNSTALINTITLWLKFYSFKMLIQLLRKCLNGLICSLRARKSNVHKSVQFQLKDFLIYLRCKIRPTSQEVELLVIFRDLQLEIKIEQKIYSLPIRELKTKMYSNQNFSSFYKIQKRKICHKKIKMGTLTAKKSLEIFGIYWERRQIPKTV